MVVAFCDGGSRGNPGNAGIGIVIKDGDDLIYSLGEYIGTETNNVAEYKGLIKALEILMQLEIYEAKIHLDSELVVKQINGIYKVKNIELQKLFVKAIELIKNMKKIEVVHVRREFNKEADALVNVALDNKEKGELTKIEKFGNKNKSSNQDKEYVLDDIITNKLHLLKSILKSYKSVVVAYSGGIDSSLLSYVAHEVLGDKMMAMTIVGEQTISQELQYARLFTDKYNILHKEIKISIFDDNNNFDNSKERCYHCKKRNFGIIIKNAKLENISIVCDGTNRDDLKEHRPGLKAIEELEVFSPFVEAGISKSEVLAIAKFYNLDMEKKESNTCLITRIPVGQKVTKEKLFRINKCETYLKSLIEGTVRVRDFDDYCVVEADESLEILKLKSDIKEFFVSVGFNKIYLDLDGYKQGSMDGREK